MKGWKLGQDQNRLLKEEKKKKRRMRRGVIKEWNRDKDEKVGER